MFDFISTTTFADMA